MRKFYYPVKLTKQGASGYLVEFIDLSEAITQGETIEDALEQARDCLAESIANRIKMKLDIPIPSNPKKGQYCIFLPAILVAKAALYLRMRDLNLSNIALAKKLNCNEKEVRRLLDPRYCSKIYFLERVLNILGKHLCISIIDSKELYNFDVKKKKYSKK